MIIDGPFLLDSGGRRFVVTAPCCALGRSESSHVYIPDQRASRRHAEIRREGEVCYLQDLDSMNGTYLNGRRIADCEMLHDGDCIEIAGTRFVFHDPDATLQDSRSLVLRPGKQLSEVLIDGRVVTLSPKEYALFDLLFRCQGQVCTHAEIAAVVWPEYRTSVAAYQVQSLIKRLREKLEPDPRHPVMFLTIRGHGYLLRLN